MTLSWVLLVSEPLGREVGFVLGVYIYIYIYLFIYIKLKRKTPKRGVNWVFQKLFQHNKFKHNRSKYNEIELENSNSNFIVVQHFLAYVHSPQAPNRVRVPLTWSFNQAFNILYIWIPTPMDSYTISSRFNLLEGSNTQFNKNESVNLALW